LKKFTNAVRSDILKMIHNAKSGHPGGALSCCDILAVLYNKILNVPVEWDKSPDFKTRDRFILSKGHASPALYATLAHCGYFSKNLLKGFRMLGSKLQGHPSSRTKLPGIEVSTGSLGQGLSIGVGIALALRLDKINSKVFVLLGDGEMQEGNKLILSEVQHLQDVTISMKSSMDEMSIGAQKINETGTVLTEVADRMKDSIVKIGNQIDEFKV